MWGDTCKWASLLPQWRGYPKGERGTIEMEGHIQEALAAFMWEGSKGVSLLTPQVGGAN